MMLTFMALASTKAFADEVRIDFQGLDLVGDLVTAKGKSLKRHGVVVLLHDVMSYNEEQSVVDLRVALVAKGLNVLAINLSLGLDGRKGLYDCAIEQDHLYEDALPEIHAWVKWLQRAKVKNISLLGIGLGGSQIALYGSKTTQKSVRRVLLLNPTTTTKDGAEKSYQQLHGTSLQGVVFDAVEKIAAELPGSLMEETGFLNCPKARVTARSFASYYRKKAYFDTTTLMSSIRKPTLVIAAELGEASEQLVLRMQQVEARPKLKLDVIEGADTQFSGGAMEQVADRIKLFSDETKGK